MPPEAVARYVELLRTLLLEYEEVAGPALGGAGWSAQRASMRGRLGEVRDLASLSGALVAMEAGLAERMPQAWTARRGTWTSMLGGAPRPTVLGDGVRELLGASMKAPALDEEQREHVRRIYSRFSLLLDTCLAAGA
jgi:hypothetical protein